MAKLDSLQFEITGISPGDAQFLEALRLQLAEIAILYDVPAHLIGGSPAFDDYLRRFEELLNEIEAGDLTAG